jgi:glycine/D-amino acid oxidase-like deaminating enzyme
MERDHDIAVIGGGLVGAAIAWGLAREKQRVVVLDEGDIAKRASRGNFALVWVQSKGLGLAEYVGWTVRSSDDWPRLAAELEEETGLDVCFQRPGGFALALSEAELAARKATIERIHRQPGVLKFSVEILDRETIAKMQPGIGPSVVGGSYCALDGHVNSLRLFRAFHVANARLGIDYRPGHTVRAIRHKSGAFRIETSAGAVHAGKVVLAAGNANAQLAPMVGLHAPMRGNHRGQIVVTRRMPQFLRYPVVTLRQTDEGTVMIGDSYEDASDDASLTLAISSVMADRARRMFPILDNATVVRTWSCLRVMTQDGFPIYDQSETCPGAFVACCHSGVTLAANHAFDIAPMIARGALDAQLLAPFSARRFHVQKAA